MNLKSIIKEFNEGVKRDQQPRADVVSVSFIRLYITKLQHSKKISSLILLNPI